MKYTKNKCDSLLTPVIIKLYPKCLLCGNPTQVAHHHCHKSKSNMLRHDLKNLVNLCHHCHQMLHFNESYWASKVVQIKGLRWFKYIEKKKQETLRYPDYEKTYKKLSKLL